MMLVRSLASELLPYEARSLLSSCLDGLRSRMSWRHTITIEQSDGCTCASAAAASTTTATTRSSSSGWRRAIEELVEAFQGAEFTWCLHFHDLPAGDPGKNVLGGNGRRGGKLYFELSFHKRHKETALKAYVPYIVATAKAIRDQERPLTIYMNDGSDWSAMDLHHPSTFDTLAMDRALKQSVIDDLDKFVRRKAYYKRIGKAWKRGYLLYGPPGTGKSSLMPSSPPLPTTSGSTSMTLSSPALTATSSSGSCSLG
ncbi:putative mitochondrial chaperone BCS1-B [Panicum miliaceum]|uniref:Mitochondrial chaperone BCS1-B n=1 Tax=Panicum miliaceum TaxID=4540 RepID=A0A3L6PKK3_PANMI|nr:putative mitochondrial chaperone BCS1-B [Panicum miliaceum]